MGRGGGGGGESMLHFFLSIVPCLFGNMFEDILSTHLDFVVAD